MQQDGKFDFAETDRVMEQLRAQLTDNDSDKAKHTSAIAPDDEPPAVSSVEHKGTSIAEAEKKEEAPAISEEPMTLEKVTSDAMEEPVILVEKPPVEIAPDFFEEETDKEPEAEAPMPAKKEKVTAAKATAPIQPAPDMPVRGKIEELPYAKKGNVFAPFGFADGNGGANETPAATEEKNSAVDEKKRRASKVTASFGSLGTDSVDAAPTKDQTSVSAASEKSHRETTVYAPFALAGQKPEDAPRGISALEDSQADAAGSVQAETPAVVAAASAPAFEQKSVSVARATALPHEATHTQRQSEDLTVDGLLTDIFGKQAGESGRGWFDRRPNGAMAAHGRSGRTAGRYTDKESSIGRKNAIKSRINARAQKMSTGPQDAAVDATVQCGGQTVVIPKDTDRFFVPAKKKTAENEQNQALFSALSVERPDAARAARQQAPAAKTAPGRSFDPSEENLRLLLDLDYENELGAVMGYEKIREYRERALNGNTGDKSRKKNKKHFDYGSHAQDVVIGKHYAKRRRRHILDLTVSLILLVLLFVYERPQFMDRWFGTVDIAKDYPFLYVLCGLLIFSVGVLLLKHQLVNGFIQMLRISPTDHSLCSVSVFITYIYHIALLFAPQDRELALYLSPAVCNMMLLSLANLLDGHRETAAFRVISCKQQKYALLPRISVGNRSGDMKTKLADDDKGGRVWYVHPVDFVRNYFTNTEKKSGHNRSFGALLLIVLSMGITCGLFVFAMGATVRETAHAVFVTLMVCLPAVSVLITSLPMFLAVPLQLKRKGAIIGEAAVYDAKDSATLVLPACEVFIPMHHEKFELVKDSDTITGTILIKALLEKLNSPMTESVSVDPTRRMSPAAITLTEIAEDGVSAVAADDQGSTILFGSVEYLAKYGITVTPRDDEEDYEALCRRLLCVAINGRLTALFLARYRLESEISRLLASLHSEDVTLTVRAKDPGIHAELLERLTADEKMTIAVEKPLIDELDIRADRVDATVVATGSCREVARTYVTCRRIRRAGLFGKGLQIASVVCGVLLTGALAYFGRIVSVPAYAVTLYMLFWCLFHGFSSYLYLRKSDSV